MPVSFTLVVDIYFQLTGLRSYSHTNASISGDRTQYAIRKIEQRSKHIYTPLAEEDGEVATFAV